MSYWPKFPFGAHSCFVLVDCQALVWGGVTARAAPCWTLDGLIDQNAALHLLGAGPIWGEDHLICYRSREENVLADALAGAASGGKVGLVWGWDFAAMRALCRVWREGGVHWVVRGSCDGSFHRATEAEPARAGAGGAIEIQIFDKRQRCILQARVFHFGVQMRPEDSGSFDAECRALEIVLIQLGILLEQVIKQDCAA